MVNGMKVNKSMFLFLQGIVRDGELHAWKWVQHSKISDHVIVSHFDGAEIVPSRVEIKKAPATGIARAS